MLPSKASKASNPSKASKRAKIYTVLSGMDGGQGQFQLWTGGVLDFMYNFTFNPALAHPHATGSSGDLF